MALGLFPVVSDNIRRDTHDANAASTFSLVELLPAPLSSPSQVRVLIRDCGDEQHVRRVGAALLSIAPGAHASSHILLHRQQVGKADGAYTLQVRGAGGTRAVGGCSVCCWAAGAQGGTWDAPVGGCSVCWRGGGVVCERPVATACGVKGSARGGQGRCWVCHGSAWPLVSTGPLDIYSWNKGGAPLLCGTRLFWGIPALPLTAANPP